jgi:CRP-like cAMP-binding protein/rhodanese-related sulfurtransferase
MSTVDNDLKRRMLHAFVPVNALTEDHLDTLLRDTQVEVVCRGQTLCRRGDRDDSHIYLLSGSVAIEGGGAAALQVDADDPEARFPLAHHQPRLETVVALTDCQVIRFASDRLDAMLAWDQAADYIILDISAQRDMDEDADWMLMLLRSNLFYKVPPMNIRQILSRFQPVFAYAGDAVIRQGELGDCCYFIKEGSVAVYRADDEKSKSELVAELGVGRCFGEDALVNEAPRNATVLMAENGVLMRLDKQDFYLLLKTPPVRSVGFADLEREMAAGAVLIDVRGSDEFERMHIPCALNMPLSILQLKARQLDRGTRYIAYCDSGRRSSAAAYLLAEDGYDVTVLRGGVDALSAAQRRQLLSEGDPSHLAREQQLAG